MIEKVLALTFWKLLSSWEINYWLRNHTNEWKKRKNRFHCGWRRNTEHDDGSGRWDLIFTGKKSPIMNKSLHDGEEWVEYPLQTEGRITSRCSTVLEGLGHVLTDRKVAWPVKEVGGWWTRSAWKEARASYGKEAVWTGTRRAVEKATETLVQCSG